MKFDFTPTKDFLIGIDSDGCVFDTMELKQKECFTPNTIRFWGLQGVSKYAREACDFVNLYSKSRGINRFLSLIEELDWLARRPEVKARGVKIDVPQSLRDWVKRETKLGNPALTAEVERTDDPGLRKTLEWSLAINDFVDMIVGSGVPPFPCVRESLEKMRGKADILVVSATPQDALVREWEEQDLIRHVAAICGQEIGTKKESLVLAAKYPKNRTLMIGDAPGDHKAALANDALFYPINPGDEERSWQRLGEEGLERFFAGTFAGEYQNRLVEEFNAHLPATPPWKTE
ncbi:MAG TPA: haloacid dehalogenase [Planctomycetaceae bacterium]|nr:haloacid dehalogenase [Planctomycetaceae bacterium]